MNPLLNILPKLKPGYLSTIEIRIHKLEGDKMKRMVELEQWKQAKYFTMSGFHCENDFYVIPLFYLHHFKTFDVIQKQLSVEDIRQIKEILFNSPSFEYCLIRLINRFDTNLIRNEFGDAIEGRPDTYHYPAPNSQEFFEIYGREWEIKITRKQK
ncbi:hypothetical protein CAEBREN_16633 [Caenorhabditis brenneri]|uniref:DUF38 domain-containing protein n=1 Tax=Caenorhabditis brenneri TaxID=135651 RepID=G0P3E1_CAEBE|nr:hypothetical protein CAEBREN_16633 [Caenorhabditis brenneri]